MVRPILVLATFVLAFTVATMPGLAQTPTSPDFAPGELVVKFQPQIGGQSARQVLRGEGVTLLESSRRSGLLRVQTPPGREAEIIAQLRARRDVEFATYNYRVRALEEPDDPLFPLQWALDNVGQSGGLPGADIDAPEAWDVYTGGNNITLAIIDSGVDLDHPDLQANIWINSGEVPGNLLDDDNNGYIDDVYGWDFCNTMVTSCDQPQDNDPNDENSHGTHVAGIAAAVGNNGIGIAGVSWAAKIMPLKMLDSSGNGTTFGLAQAIHYAADNGAQIINMSLGGACESWPDVEDAIEYAVSKGVLLIAASGNQGSNILCPASLAGVMAVGATNGFDGYWSGSNYGDQLEVSAPGDFIYSTTIDGNYSTKTGTSMASPHVAGLAALVWSLGPSLTAEQISATIRETSDDLGSQGWDPYFGYGRINARRALEALKLWTPPEKTLFIDDETASIFTAIPISTASPEVITWTAAISPTVSWLSLVSPDSGTISSASSPTELNLEATHPFTYGLHTADIVVSGVTTNGDVVGPRETKIKLTYQAPVYRMHFPLIFKN